MSCVADLPGSWLPPKTEKAGTTAATRTVMVPQTCILHLSILSACVHVREDVEFLWFLYITVKKLHCRLLAWHVHDSRDPGSADIIV